MRMSKNVASPKELALRIDRFRGLDLSVPPVNVKPYRATKMRNLICEDGLTRKRNGWREIFRIRKNGVPQEINGVFHYENGEYKVLIVHAGNWFYKAVKGDKGYTVTDITLSSTFEAARCDTSLLESRKSVAFHSKGRMYIVGAGDYLVYGTWDEGESYELRRVTEDIDTYVPTTTISIDADGVTDVVRSTLDDVNILTRRRKNTLVGKDDSGSVDVVFWTLDAKVDCDKKIKITGRGYDKRNFVGPNIPGGSSNIGLAEFTIENDPTAAIANRGDLYLKLAKGENRTFTESENNKYKCGGVALNGRIYLDFGITPDSGAVGDNITVEFYAEKERKKVIVVEGEAYESAFIDEDGNRYIMVDINNEERVTKARFGTMFGVEGNSDRLFVAGNPDHKNIDFYSEMDDLTYFADRASSAVGSGGAAIMGYGRIADNTLAIYKEGSLHEPTVFYRTGKNREEYDENGVLAKITALFPTFGGAEGEGLVSNFASANLAGDPLILSKNGVFGIELSENLSVPDRYTRERSRPIRGKLTKQNLSDAVGTVYQNRYYLAAGGEIYVADPSYKYRGEDSGEVSYNYEWWAWDHCPVRVFANIGDLLGFGDADGRVCVFDEEYTDRTYYRSVSGDITLHTDTGGVTYNEYICIELAEGDGIKFETEGIYGCLDRDITVEDGRLHADTERILSVHEGMEVFADNVGESGLVPSQSYFITDIDRGEMTYSLQTEDGEMVTPMAGGFSLHRSISWKTLYIASLTESTFMVREFKDGAILPLSPYNGSVPTDSVIAEITHFENVIAEWVTPVFDLGTTEYGKSLRRMTITLAPQYNGKLSFGYETRNASRLAMTRSLGAFSLEDFSFSEFSLDTGFTGSCSVPCCERQFNYILFRFMSDDDRGCAVTGFTATYTITPIRTRGVR